MTSFLAQTGVLKGGAVAAQSVPNFTVQIEAINFLNANQYIPVLPTASLTITAADATNPRWTIVYVDNTGAVGTIDGVPTAPDSNGNVPIPTLGTNQYALALVYVLATSDPSYTGTITNAYITDVRAFIAIYIPPDAQMYTYIGAAAVGDPGAGNFTTDTALNGTMAHMSVSYSSPTMGAGVSLAPGYFGNPVTGAAFQPYYLLIYQISNPGNKYLMQVTAYTDHSTWADLTVTPIFVGDGAGGVGAWGGRGTGISQDPSDCALLYLGIVPTAGVTSVFGRTGAVVAVTGDYSGNLIKRTVYTSGTSATHNFNSATKTVRILAVGGGGGGGGASGAVSSAAAGAGGGGGGTVDVLVSVGANTSLTYTVGAGGTAGANTGGTGGDGGNTTVVLGATTYTAGKGFGGQGMAFGTSAVSVSGGAGGTSTNGDLNIGGEDGESAFRTSGTFAWAGDGGSSSLGGAGGNTQAPSNGVNGRNYGGAGGGAVSIGTGSHTGGVGSAGVVIIEEYS